MGSALFTGVTGLLAHQRRLDVTASNIANINTTGYRSSRILFQDLFSQTIRGGSAPVGNFGGSNPQQIGLGVQVASIDVDFGQGSLVTTGISSDLAIQGNGFFVLSDGMRSSFSRDGSFTLNAEGLLIEPSTGKRVQGFLADEMGVIPESALSTDINIPIGGTAIVRETDTATLGGNLNSDAVDGNMVTRTIVVFDSLGTERPVTATFTKDAADNTWTWLATYDNGVGTPTVGTGTIEFDAEGRVTTGAIGSVSISTLDLGSPSSPPADPFAFDLNFELITQLAQGGETDPDTAVFTPTGSTVALRSQDGFPLGVLESFNIGGNGEINGVFTNGLTRVIAQVALASFSNVGGLSRDGNNTFVETPASGVAQIGRPATSGRGTVVGGVLENSNVDLGTEFSNLIITQRGFQANARTITAADTVLQETVNLVR